MIYPFDLKTVGIALGLILILAHAFAFAGDHCRRALLAFPRSRVAGTILIAIAGIWSFLLIREIDLGEFAGLRSKMLIAIVVGTILAWKFVPEFLAVRALGMIALLAAEPLLGAAFLRPETSRLLVVFLAYAWIIAGLFWVGMPWMLRDQISWVTKNGTFRLKAAAAAGAVYGLAVLVCAVLFW